MKNTIAEGKLRMEYLVTAEEMQRYDEYTTKAIGIPGLVLMEQAATAAYQMISERWGSVEHPSALILAGVGNNGGDGLALARLLLADGWQVRIWCVGQQYRVTNQWLKQRAILAADPLIQWSKPEQEEYTILVDALFGVGLSRPIVGEYAEAVSWFQRCKGWKLALDMPSGVSADNGQLLGCAIQVDQTVTFGFCKRGLMLYPGCEYAGEITVAPIGISERSFQGRKPEMFTYRGEVSELLPQRSPRGNKGTFGKVLLIAGDYGMAGAAVLAAKAVLRAGAGMVKVLSHPENRQILQQAVPEALYGDWTELSEHLDWAHVIAIGPGLGRGMEGRQCLEQVLRDCMQPLVIDGDALNLLAEDPALWELLEDQGKRGRSVILTPHAGELSRLTGQSISVLKENLPKEAFALAESLRVTVAAKDARTCVAKAGELLYLNQSGNDGMATAGSGDVLTGIIAGLLGQGMDPYKAACAGVYWHGCAGDCAAAGYSRYCMTAGSILEHMGTPLMGD